MPKRLKGSIRPAQGVNSVKKIVKKPAGGDNVRIGPSSGRNNKPRGYA